MDNHGQSIQGIKMTSKICKVIESEARCNNLVRSLGMCTKHYARFRKHGGNSFRIRAPQDGRTKKRLYNIWFRMHDRCYKQNDEHYNHYGGRGISVCDRWNKFVSGWEGFDNFLEDMGERPSKKYSLDRINNDGNYEPGNCRWATRHTQVSNRRISSSHVGVHWDTSRKHWISRLSVNSKLVLNSSFETFEMALAARQKAEKIYLIERVSN